MDTPKGQRLRTVGAFAAIYFVWGSTFAAAEVALRQWPPFLLAGARFGIAGIVLLAWGYARGHRMPQRGWLRCALSGVTLFVLGNGLLVFAQTRTTSSLAALAVATIPLWIVSIDAVRLRAVPGPRTWTAMGLGILGVLLLSGPLAATPAAFLAIIVSAAAWSGATVYVRYIRIPSLRLRAGAQMVSGAAVLMTVSLVRGETWSFPSQPTLGALAYLTVFGSIVTFLAYAWLLDHVESAKVATYAFVNPIVAVAIGVLWLGEPLSPRTAAAATAILAAVVVINTSRLRRPSPPSARVAR